MFMGIDGVTNSSQMEDSLQSVQHTVRCGEILHIEEVLSLGRAANAKSVRVLGALLEFDAETCRAVIEHQGTRLTVDTSALGSTIFRAGELMQFIGEVSLADADTLELRARVVRNVSGLNLDLYDQAVHAKRQFEQQLLQAQP